MPSNKQQILEMECRKNLDKVLMTALPSIGELLLTDVIREAVLQYPVSPGFVRRFIMDFYVDAGVVKLQDDVLTPVRK